MLLYCNIRYVVVSLFDIRCCFTTMIIAESAAIFEVDIKKIIALSTLSQLGLMFITLDIGLPLMAFFHLIAHAYFKAILFIRCFFV